MTVYDFVVDLFNSCREGAEPITIEDAAADIKNFKREGWQLPEDLTPEEYAETWNKLCEAG